MIDYFDVKYPLVQTCHIHHKHNVQWIISVTCQVCWYLFLPIFFLELSNNFSFSGPFHSKKHTHLGLFSFRFSSRILSTMLYPFFSSLSIICSFKLQMMLIWNICRCSKSLNCSMLRRHLWRRSCSYMQQYNHKIVVLFWKWMQKNLSLNFILDLFIKIVQILILVRALTRLASFGSHTLGSLYECNAIFF